MAAITHLRTINHVAKILGEDVELLEAIICNDDNLTYGNIVKVYASPDEAISALTDDGIEELKDMIQAARISTKTWHTFLDDFVDDADLVTQIKAKSPR
jgi:hypothetical protein